MVPSAYWERARFEFDRQEPLCVIVVMDGEEVPERTRRPTPKKAEPPSRLISRRLD
jgi:hypothetical protein